MTAVAATPAPRPLDVGAMLKEAGLTALIALALTLPLVGLRTVDTGGGLTVQTRFTEVAIAVLLVFIGRIGLVLTRESHPLPVLLVSLAIAAVSWFLPFPTASLKVIAIAGALVLAIRAALAVQRGRSKLSRQERDRSCPSPTGR
jgi:branched-chain amino acid transport system permease protein